MTTLAPAAPVPAGRADLSWAAPESPLLTAVYWAVPVLYVSAFWLARFPPCIDYPEHLAIAATIARMVDSASPERLLFEFTPLTYNGLFHVLAAALAQLIDVEHAGRIVLSLVAPLTALSALELVKVAGRPPSHAFFVLPLSYSGALGWGFVNYALAAPLGLLVCAWWLRHQRGERGLGTRIALTSLAIAYAHVLAMLCLLVSITILALAGRSPGAFGAKSWLSRRVSGGLLLLPAVAYDTLVYLEHRRAPHIFWEPHKDFADDPLVEKIIQFPFHAAGNLSDRSDERLFLSMLLVMVASFCVGLARRSLGRGGSTRELWMLAIAWAGLYLVVPKVLMSTWFIYERLPFWVIAFAAASLPVVQGRAGLVFRFAAASIALAAAGNVAVQLARLPEPADASAVVDDIPARSRLIALTYAQSAEPPVHRAVWVHHSAYFVARRPGETAYGFTRYASLPLRYRTEAMPPLPPGGVEWLPEHYDPSSDYALYFDTVLVRTPDHAPEEDPARLAFGAFAGEAQLISRRGRFWLYDSSGVARAARGEAARR